MSNLETIKQAAAVVESYVESYKTAQKTIEDFIQKSGDEQMYMAAFIKYMQVFGKAKPEEMSEAKELFAELERIGK